MANALATLTGRLAQTLGMGNNDGDELLSVLKQTAFKGPVSDAQMSALMIVANQYGLNPWTKEIYAFPDRQNGIVPVVGVDGWARIINAHPAFDGMDFEQGPDSCTCTIYRKDRAHPTRVTEWMAECKREGVGPWKSHPYRMLRHKATIQCARLAFGFTGIYDEDEASRINEAQQARNMGPAVVVQAAALASAPVPMPAGLLESAEDAALLGVAGYAAYWRGITKEQRSALKNEHARLKAAAEEVDAERTVEQAPPTAAPAAATAVGQDDEPAPW